MCDLNSLARAVSTPGGASPQDVAVFIGLWFSVVGLLALKYRQEVYQLLQSIKAYPNRGVVRGTLIHPRQATRLKPEPG